MSYKYTKIIATLGPVSESKSVMKQMLESGLNIARFNFSHGSYPHHALLMRNFRAVAKELHIPVALIQDLQGPRVRIAKLPDRGIKVVNGEHVTFAYKDSMDSSSADIPVDYPLYKHMKPGDRILIQDGLIQVQVTKIQGQTIVAKVTEGGTIYTHKGINIPDTSLTTSALTPKDRKDLIFGLSQKVDFVAISFVEKAGDVRLLKKLIHDAKPQQTPKIIVKIERAKAIKNFQEILAETDAIMIARGDLGVDLPAEDVPLLQKDIIKQCLRAGKPVIVATQMLESMIESPRPTRAEASDVANAVIDHTDAIMLSGETAFGKHPVECIKTMHNIAVKTEGSEYSHFPEDFFDAQSQDFVDTLSGALSNFSKQKKLKGIVVLTGDNSFLARVIARRRAEVPVFAVTDNMETYGELVLSWGIYPVYMKVKHRDHLVSAVLKNLKKEKFLKKGDMVALVNNYAENTPEVTCHEC